MERFLKKHTALLQFAFALSCDTRLAILAMLIKGELSVNTIADTLALPQSNVSRHLAVLRKRGLVSCRVDATQRYYRSSFIVIRKGLRSLDDLLTLPA